jgi:hypothetical protein
MNKKSLQEILSDPYLFISRLKIINKDGKIVKLSPNEEQMQIIEALDSGDDILILKARQIGSSTITAAYFFWKIYTSSDPVNFAILSHKLASSKHLLKMHQTFYDNLPVALKKPLSVQNTTEIRFKDSGAGIIAVSAGGEGGLRSFTCSYLHMSEYAFSPNPEELKATAISALNNGQLIIESTANYYGDALHSEVLKSIKGEAEWNYLFFPWYEHREYSLEASLPGGLTSEEESLMGMYNLDEAQIAWRRSQISKIGLEKFRREYPIDLEEAYSISGSVWMSRETIGDIPVLDINPKGFTKLSDPDKCDAYAIGVDVSAGIGRDFSVIYVISKKTYSPVLIWRDNNTPPAALAEIIVDVATTYNNALVLVESNNFGNVVLNEMYHIGYEAIWKEDGKDWITTSKSKTAMFENLKELIRSSWIKSLDNIAYTELRSIKLSDKSLIELSETGGAHCDNAVALALSYVCLDKVKLKEVSYLPNWIKQRSIQKIVRSGGVAIESHRRY